MKKQTICILQITSIKLKKKIEQGTYHRTSQRLKAWKDPQLIFENANPDPCYSSDLKCPSEINMLLWMWGSMGVGPRSLLPRLPPPSAPWPLWDKHLSSSRPLHKAFPILELVKHGLKPWAKKINLNFKLWVLCILSPL